MSKQISDSARSRSITVGSGPDAVKICYEVYEHPDWTQADKDAGTSVPRQRVVLIMGWGELLGSVNTSSPLLRSGLAAGQGAWAPQLRGLLHSADSEPLSVLTLDNRGVGQSDCPQRRSAYSTDRMAEDVCAVMDHLQWRAAHIVGHSMGGMIAARLAVQRPDRVASLTIVSSTNGGWQAVPFRWRTVKYCWKAFRAKNAAMRAKFDLKLHFMREFLKAPVQPEGQERRVALLREYTGVDADEGARATEEGSAEVDPAAQTQHGVRGQLSAVWRHRLSASEFQELRAASFPMQHGVLARWAMAGVQVVHGRHDIVAAPKHSEQMAARLGCRCTMLQGAHFITRECSTELNSLLRGIIFTQLPPPDEHITNDAALEVVSSLRCVSVDLGAALGANAMATAGVATGRASHVTCGSAPLSLAPANGQPADGVSSRQQSGRWTGLPSPAPARVATAGDIEDELRGSSPTASEALSSVGSNLALIGGGGCPSSRLTPCAGESRGSPAGLLADGKRWLSSSLGTETTGRQKFN